MRSVLATPGARATAFAVDLMLLAVTSFLTMLVTLVASTPWWHQGGGQGEGAAGALSSLNKAVPPWLSWVTLAVIALLAAGLSGALSRSGPRASTGMYFAELRLVRASVAADADPDRPPRVDPDDARPARWQVVARWLVPLLVFGVVTVAVSGLAAALVALAGWAVALAPGRRSVYDRLVGVTVVRAGWAERQRPHAGAVRRT